MLHPALRPGRGRKTRENSRLYRGGSAGRREELKMATAKIQPVRASRSRTLRRVWRTLCPRDADGGARRTGAALRESEAGPQVSANAWTNCCAPTPAVPRLCSLLSASPRNWAGQRSISSAKICFTPARTRSTTVWDRRCWLSAWASIASSPRPAPGSMAWPPPRCARCWALNASCTWGRKTCGGRSSTFSACGCWARKSAA